MRTKSLLFSAILALAAASPTTARETILSLNEAIWPNGIGSINYFDGNRMISNNWFEEVNDGEELGYTPNDIIQVNDNLFAIAVNYSHTVVFIDASGHMVGKLLDGDTGDGATPNCRFLVSDGTYLYLTGYDQRLYWYPDSENPDAWEEASWDEGGYVAKIDPTTFKVIAYTSVGWEPDRIAIYGGKLFVFNSGGYAPVGNPNGGNDHSDYETTVSIIDPGTMTVDRVLDTTRINLYRGLSQSGKWLLANSAGDYYETYPSMILIDCDKVLEGEPDDECYVYNSNYASTYSTATLDGKFLAVGSAFSYNTMGYEYKYVTIDPQEFWDGKISGNESYSGIYAELPGTMLDDIMQFEYPYDIYQNPYTGYYYATDAAGGTSGDESGGKLYQWDPEGKLIGTYPVGVFPAHILAVAPRKMPVKFVLSSNTPTGLLVSKEDGEKIELNESAGRTPTFTVDIYSGDYTLIAYNKDGQEAGSIDITVADSFDEQTITVQAPTIYVKNADWEYGTDYTFDVAVSSAAGELRKITLGNSVTAGRKHFLALKGDSYRAAFVPSETRAAEDYATIYRNGTLTYDATVSVSIPKANYMEFLLPADASLQISRKTNHFVDFTPVEAASTAMADGKQTVTYRLPEGETFYYRTWREGGLTQAGYFTAGTEVLPRIEFTEESFSETAPDTYNHDFASNDGYETGDILINVNERGHLNLDKGQTFRAHAMRSWQIVDGLTSNNFVEPDFHFTAYNVTIDTNAGTATIDAEPSETVVSVSHEPGSAWADIKAVGNGTAIVLVTYDAIRAQYFDKTGNAKPFVGGDLWGAIWPENTAVFVVTVGQQFGTPSRPDMFLHDDINVESEKVAGFNLDAEHDIFYFPDTEEGCVYTVKPWNVLKKENGVWISSPVITEDGVQYTEFTPCESNGDGTYNVMLREGRNIIRLVSAAKRSTYQVITAHACNVDMFNLTNPTQSYKPGDEVEVCFSGLRHPSNKLAGIYNMSAQIAYKELPDGVTINPGRSQYQFSSAKGAQSFTFTVPETMARSGEELTFSGGAIQVSGFGDPFGSHRSVSPEFGRSPNFTAISHKALLGTLPSLTIDPKSTSGVENVSDADAEPVMYYNLQGVSSSEPFRGLNIVVYSDGSVRKIHFNL